MFGRRISLAAVLFVLAGLLPGLAIGGGSKAFNGKWKLIPDKSSEISLYRNLSMEI